MLELYTSTRTIKAILWTGNWQDVSDLFDPNKQHAWINVSDGSLHIKTGDNTETVAYPNQDYIYQDITYDKWYVMPMANLAKNWTKVQ